MSNKVFALCIYLCALTGTTAANAASYAVSDLLIAMESDGRSHTVQHTIAAENGTLTLSIPGSVIPQQIRFLNGEKNQLNTLDGNSVELNDGAAMVRYQHQYGDSVTHSVSEQFTLTTLSIPENVSFDQGSFTHSSITWVFPTDLEVTSYTVTDPKTGTWVSENNTLTYYQAGNDIVPLSINYRIKDKQISSATILCTPDRLPNDACSPDEDQDGIPDYRDLCLNQPIANASDLGCEQLSSVQLADIVFANGQSYLDIKARQLLDRVAYALRKQPDSYFEISAHTDNVGSASHNKQLSQKRADAVRHYLMLRGVGPNNVRATGYGESYPIRDNADSEGKRANRRIELTSIE